MKRRLLIARALLNQPRIIIADEPTTGLDPQARHLIWQRLRQLKGQGVTLILTTQYMEEAQQLCDRIVIMHRGRILKEGAPCSSSRRRSAAKSPRSAPLPTRTKNSWPRSPRWPAATSASATRCISIATTAGR